MVLFHSSRIMANKRRTRKQKLVATTRHNYEGQLTITTSGGQTHIRINNSAEKVENPTKQSTQRTSHTYVLPDVRNTLTITSILIILDIAIYFILKLRFISIPGIGF